MTVQRYCFILVLARVVRELEEKSYKLEEKSHKLEEKRYKLEVKKPPTALCVEGFF